MVSVNSPYDACSLGYHVAAVSHFVSFEECSDRVKRAAVGFQNTVAYSENFERFAANYTFVYGFVHGLYDTNPDWRGNVVDVFNNEASREHMFLNSVKIFDTPISIVTFDRFYQWLNMNIGVRDG